MLQGYALVIGGQTSESDYLSDVRQCTAVWPVCMDVIPVLPAAVTIGDWHDCQ